MTIADVPLIQSSQAPAEKEECDEGKEGAERDE
jgi:hypothetical protein